MTRRRWSVCWSMTAVAPRWVARNVSARGPRFSVQAIVSVHRVAEFDAGEFTKGRCHSRTGPASAAEVGGGEDGSVGAGTPVGIHVEYLEPDAQRARDVHRHVRR